MKRVLTPFVLTFVSLLLVFYAVFRWWCHVTILDPAGLAALEQRVQAREAERAAQPKAENGFEDLRSLWGFVDEPKDPVLGAQVEALPIAYKNQPDFGLQTTRGLVSGLGEAEKLAQALYPALRTAMEKPQFAWPGLFQTNNRVPDLVAIREACQTLAALGSLRALRGDWEGAIEAWLLGLGTGARVAGNDGLLAVALGTSCASANAQPLLEALQARRLTSAQLEEVLKSLRALPLAASQFVTATDVELAMALQTLRSLPVPPVLGAPYLNRERGLLVNAYLQRRPGLERLELEPASPSLEQAWAWDPLALDLAPHYGKQEAHFKFLLGRVTGLQLMTWLELQRLDESLPEALPSTLPNLPLGLEGFSYRKQGQDYVLSWTHEVVKLAGVESGTLTFRSETPQP